MEVNIETRTEGREDEAIVAELAETVELQARKLASMNDEVDRAHSEREQLANELHMAQAWIRELAAELEEVSPRPEPDPFTLRGRIFSP
jgi:predicted RNase H-like nuclease (RuvC/YqgF family)